MTLQSNEREVRARRIGRRAGRVELVGLLPQNPMIVTLSGTPLELAELAVRAAPGHPVTSTTLRGIIPDDAFRLAARYLALAGEGDRPEITLRVRVAASGRLIHDEGSAAVPGVEAQSRPEFVPRYLPGHLRELEAGAPYPAPPSDEWRAKVMGASPTSKESMQAVADLWLLARSRGVPPHSFVQWALGTSKATASRRIHAVAENSALIELPERKPRRGKGDA
ncbi:hypothetical protein [Agromyces sp. Marseille-Q5079]|uniref:hypothetical protein n=1 Tax=Agromyces sp. Marseille-Q5079 TaxID=3439059 RepID=UPI003D9CBE7E